MRSTTTILLLALVSSLPACQSTSHSSVKGVASATTGPRTNPALVEKYEALADSILEARKKEVEIVRSVLKDTFQDAQSARESARKAIAAADAPASRASLEELATLVAHLASEGDASMARVRKQLVEGGHHFNPLLNQPGAPGAGHHGKEAPPHHATDPAAGSPSEKGAEKGHAADPKAAAPPAGEPSPNAGHHAAGEGHAKDGAHHQGAHHGDGGALGYDPGFVVVTRAAKKAFLDASRAIAQLSTAPSAEGLDREWAKVEAAWAQVNG